jgi:hypothetical protein
VGAGAWGTRFTALPIAPPKTLARSDLRAALRRREAPPLLHRITAAISSSTSTTARLHLRHGQQWRLRLIDRRYAISFSLSVSLSVSPKHLHCLANHRTIQRLVDPLTLTANSPKPRVPDQLKQGNHLTRRPVWVSSSPPPPPAATSSADAAPRPRLRRSRPVRLAPNSPTTAPRRSRSSSACSAASTRTATAASRRPRCASPAAARPPRPRRWSRPRTATGTASSASRSSWRCSRTGTGPTRCAPRSPSTTRTATAGSRPRSCAARCGGSASAGRR